MSHEVEIAISGMASRFPGADSVATFGENHRPIAFLFPGQGTQYVNMGRELYETEELFRTQIDACATRLQTFMGVDLRTLLYPPEALTLSQQQRDATQTLQQTQYAQPVLFMVEYALATLWQAWGIRPQALIGHSLGEYVAACLAGVFSLEDALRLVTLRGRLMQSLPMGAMLAIQLPAESIVLNLDVLHPDLAIAAINEPTGCVVSGPVEATYAFEQQMTTQGVACRRLSTSHAFHSSMMDPILSAFAEQVKTIRLHSPQIPIISNLTGRWIQKAEATDPQYWVNHLRQTVQFAAGIGLLLQQPELILLEVGPGRTLSTFARQHPARTDQVVLRTLRHPQETQSDRAFLLTTLGELGLLSPATIHGERRGALGATLATKPDSVAPQRQTEKVLIDIYQSVLGRKQIGVEDDFFELGGHSLTATQVIARLQKRLGIPIPIHALFDYPTIAQFANYVDRHLAEHLAGQQKEESTLFLQEVQDDLAPPLLPVERTAPLPLSFAQQRLWFLDQLEPESAFYNMRALYRLTGALDVAALMRSFTYLQERHESLRTRFATQADGTAVQVIQPSARFALPVIPVASEAEAQQYAQVEATTPFNLRTGPLLRGQLLQIAEEDHLLVLTMHHIISDGWSLGVLQREISHAYRAFAGGTQPTWPPLPIQYAYFAVWQRAYLSGERLKTQLAYWQRQLCDAPTVLELPTDRPRPPAQSYRGAHYLFQLDAELITQLNALAQRHNATLFMVLLTAFNVLLARYSGQDDIVIGTPVANRSQTEVESLIGFFVNTLVLRTRLPENPSFRALLTQVRQTTLDAYQYQAVPFEQLVDALHAERSLSYNPLFQVMFILQNTPTGTFDLPVRTATLQPTDFPFTRLDLALNLSAPNLSALNVSSFNLSEHEGGLLGTFEYATDLFDAATIARMAGHFQTLLAGIVAESPLGVDQAISHLPLLTAAEYQQIAHEWKESHVDYGPPQTLHALFEQQVARTPDAVAVVIAGNQRLETGDWRLSGNQSPISSLQSLTYRELNARANQVAHALQTLGVGGETIVGVCLERSLDWVISFLGILKAGGAYLPLDPTYPPERLAFILEDAAPAVIVTHSRHRALFSEFSESRPVLCCDVNAPAPVAQQATVNPCDTVNPAGNPDGRVRPDQLAYVIYTSGSTGKPKGVLNKHQGVAKLVQATMDIFGLQTTSRYLHTLSLNFDASISDLMIPLCAGALSVFVPPEMPIAADSLTHLLNEQSITHLNTVPTLMLQLSPERLPTLQTIIVGGEPCPAELVRRWAADHHFLNAYGPTEASIGSTVLDYRYYTPASPNQLPPIGRAMADKQLYILDAHLQRVPVGVPGELYIGGPGLARGYLNQPLLTAQRFIPNPFTSPSDGNNNRLYKTGDLVRWLPDGNIEFMGRTDFQVKIRGFRIELGEIENVLLAQAGVREAAVLVWEDAPQAHERLGAGDKRLVAYFVGEAASEYLRQALAQRLPAYMIPSAFVRLSTLPFTSNGKLDRRALPAPIIERDQEQNHHPRTLLEQQIAQIWEQTLGVYPVGIHDNFFTLGGHSLLAVQLLAKLQPLLRQQLPLRTLFAHPTVAQLAAAVQAQDVTAPMSTLVALQPGGSQPPFYCFPGVGGGVFYLHALAQALEEQPFYALESVGFDGKRAPLTSVQAAATYQLAQIQKQQAALGASKPLYLAGHSYGGLVAYELAQQWHQAGGQVGALLLLDTSAPTSQAQTKSEVELILLYERRFLEEAGLLRLTAAQLTPLTSQERLHLFKQSLEQAGYLPPNSSLEQIQGIIHVAAADLQATDYLPNDFVPLPIHLFVASDASRSATATQAMIDGWSTYGDVTVHKVPGTHTTMMYPPQVAMLAQAVAAVLQ